MLINLNRWCVALRDNAPSTIQGALAYGVTQRHLLQHGKPQGRSALVST
ncbi:hypothetical protein [Nostoc sp.]